MFFIYSLNLETLKVILYDFCRTQNGVTDLLDTVARNFIRDVDSKVKADSPYRDNVIDQDIKEDGYFLRHSAEKPYQIDVYQRKTLILEGRVWNSYDITCEKIMHFSVTEASLGMPIECTGKGVITPKFNNAREAQHQTEHLALLKERIEAQRKKVDEQLLSVQPATEYDIMVDNVDSDDENNEIHANPFTILQQRVNAEEETLNKAAVLLSQPQSSLTPPPPPPLPISTPPPPPSEEDWCPSWPSDSESDSDCDWDTDTDDETSTTASESELEEHIAIPVIPVPPPLPVHLLKGGPSKLGFGDDNDTPIINFNNCLASAAKMSVDVGAYGKAKELYEKISSQTANKKYYLLLAGLCQLLYDPEKIPDTISRYEDKSIGFSGTSEGILLEELLSSINNNDIDAYTNAIVDFGITEGLNDQVVNLLLRLKKTLTC